MASAELDYTIEIPDQPCRSQENSPNRGGKEAGTRQPLVILLGWGGCADKNLAKYSAIYHERVFCMASCLLLSPLLVDGISAGTERQLILWPDWAAQVMCEFQSLGLKSPCSFGLCPLGVTLP
uniref:Transmembrane protein 53 n=1 Tax=Equus caballus TaxID=9796 RepID=A0A5F5Q2D2_HORSE